MRLLYNCVAGQSVERLAVLSHGIFAAASTLPVLDLRVLRAGEAVHSQRDIWGILLPLTPRLVIFL